MRNSMKDVVGLTSIVQAKHGRFLQNYLHCSVFQFLHNLFSPLSLSLLSSFNCYIVIIFLAKYQQVSASKAINVIEHNDCFFSIYTDQVSPPTNMITTTTSTSTLYLNTSISIFKIYFS